MTKNKGGEGKGGLVWIIKRAVSKSGGWEENRVAGNIISTKMESIFPALQKQLRQRLFDESSGDHTHIMSSSLAMGQKPV